MHKYYDWSAFEAFVKDLYEGDGDVAVERNVIEKDRYGATRETDVKITRRTRFQKLVTLVECKRWKEPVTRARVDVLAASMDALGANSGVLFTTTGFEEGAIAYAKGKGIEAFVVRDLTPEEWGLPGRHISFYMHIAAAEFRDIGFPDAQAIALVDDNPGKVNIAIRLDKDMAVDPDQDLYSVTTGARGPNLVGILGDVHGIILRCLSTAVPLMDGGGNATLELVAACEVDLSQTEYRQLRLPTVAVRLTSVAFKLVAHISQSVFEFDRGAKLDFAVMIESYVSDQRVVAHRNADSSSTLFNFPNAKDANMTTPSDVLQNGSLFRIICAPWVGLGAATPSKKAFAAHVIKATVGVVDGKPKISMQPAPLKAP